jgi:hypothetical protein
MLMAGACQIERMILIYFGHLTTAIYHARTPIPIMLTVFMGSGLGERHKRHSSVPDIRQDETSYKWFGGPQSSQ